jgi:hypothetical protein
MLVLLIRYADSSVNFLFFVFCMNRSKVIGTADLNYGAQQVTTLRVGRAVDASLIGLRIQYHLADHVNDCIANRLLFCPFEFTAL